MKKYPEYGMRVAGSCLFILFVLAQPANANSPRVPPGGIGPVQEIGPGPIPGDTRECNNRARNPHAKSAWTWVCVGSSGDNGTRTGGEWRAYEISSFMCTGKDGVNYSKPMITASVTTKIPCNLADYNRTKKMWAQMNGGQLVPDPINIPMEGTADPAPNIEDPRNPPKPERAAEAAPPAPPATPAPKVVTAPDGTTVTIYPDGSVEVRRPDGSATRLGSGPDALPVQEARTEPPPPPAATGPRRYPRVELQPPPRQIQKSSLRRTGKLRAPSKVEKTAPRRKMVRIASEPRVAQHRRHMRPAAGLRQIGPGLYVRRSTDMHRMPAGQSRYVARHKDEGGQAAARAILGIGLGAAMGYAGGRGLRAGGSHAGRSHMGRSHGGRMPAERF